MNNSIHLNKQIYLSFINSKRIIHYLNLYLFIFIPFFPNSFKFNFKLF